MSTFLQFGLTNALVASLLAGVVICVAQRLRHPALVHLLWLLILLKLLTPPLVQWSLPPFLAFSVEYLDWKSSTTLVDESLLEAQSAESSQNIGPHSALAPDPTASPSGPPPADAAEVAPLPTGAFPDPTSAGLYSATWTWSDAIAATWLIGTVPLLVLSCLRIARFHRLLGTAREAPPAIQRVVQRLTSRMHIGSAVEVRLTSAAIPPLLWSLGRRHVVVVPAILAERLGPRPLEAVLAHELAHVKRRDYLVRWIELTAVILYWWLPTVWWVRRQLREAEEAACDAWVVETLPGRRREYAMTLVYTVETFAGATPPVPAIASGLGDGRRLIRRIERLASARSPRLSKVRLCMFALFALLTLPVSVNVFSAAAQDQAGRTEEATGDEPREEQEAPAQTAPEDSDAAQRRQAIERGIAFLKGEQEEEGNWRDPLGFEGGLTALCTLGLLDAGAPPTDEAVAKALAWLRENDEPKRIYVVSLITRVYAAAGLPEDHVRIERNADWLSGMMIDAGEFRGCWGYGVGDEQRGDNSNAHFAILGLEAAEAAGVEVPENTWRAALEYWVAAQNADGSWGYQPGIRGTGSMTASGVTALAIILSRADFTDREDIRQSAEAALDIGFTWLAKHYSITGNPVPAINRNWQRWHYYYLDALSHGCLHAKRTIIGDHDWRREVTDLLLDEQRPGGSWSGREPEDDAQLATAFALLVLTQVNDATEVDAAVESDSGSARDSLNRQ